MEFMAEESTINITVPFAVAEGQRYRELQQHTTVFSSNTKDSVSIKTVATVRFTYVPIPSPISTNMFKTTKKSTELRCYSNEIDKVLH